MAFCLFSKRKVKRSFSLYNALEKAARTEKNLIDRSVTSDFAFGKAHFSESKTIIKFLSLNLIKEWKIVMVLRVREPLSPLLIKHNKAKSRFPAKFGTFSF